MVIKTFNEIVAWQKAHELALLVYKTTEKFPKTEQFSLTSQIRRCAVSVPSNIVEGFKRRTKNDSIHFYNIAEGSLEELKYQLLLAKELQYLPAAWYEDLRLLTEDVGRLIHGWIKIQR